MSIDSRVTALIIGKELEHDIYDRDQRLLLRKGSTIKTARQLDALLNRNLFFNDHERSESQVVAKKDVKESRAISPFRILDQVRSQLTDIFKSNKSLADFSSIIMNLALLIDNVCSQDADACLSTLLRPLDIGYSIKHSIDTAIACSIVSERLGYLKKDRVTLLAAALTMNVAMWHVQDLLYFHNGPVTKFTRRKIIGHVIEGVEMLTINHVEDETWIETVLQHHEQMDGKGYPHGLAGHMISEPARVMRIADIYCAKVSGRAHRNPFAPHSAFREIYANEQGHFVDTKIAGIFIQEFGLFPPGLYVSLENGDIAIVVKRGSTPHEPLVRSILGPSGAPYRKPLLHESSNPKYAIRGPAWMSQRMVLVDRNWLWGHGG